MQGLPPFPCNWKNIAGASDGRSSREAYVGSIGLGGPHRGIGDPDSKEICTAEKRCRGLGTLTDKMSREAVECKDSSTLQGNVAAGILASQGEGESGPSLQRLHVKSQGSQLQEVVIPPAAHNALKICTASPSETRHGKPASAHSRAARLRFKAQAQAQAPHRWMNATIWWKRRGWRH